MQRPTIGAVGNLPLSTTDTQKVQVLLDISRGLQAISQNLQQIAAVLQRIETKRR